MSRFSEYVNPPCRAGTSTTPDGVMRILQSHGKYRTCLRCNRRFQSAGPGNRICPACSGYEAFTLEPHHVHTGR